MAAEFAVMILTHGRPERVVTYGTLRRLGYTGPIYLVVDDEDVTLPAYRAAYGEQVVTFAKAQVAAQTQMADNFTGPTEVVVFARNACFALAERLGIRDFLQLDDDYHHISHRFDRDDIWKSRIVRNLDAVFAAILRFYRATPFTTLALLQGGDFIWGWPHGRGLRLSRKAMNSFFCSTDRPFQFTGRLNEDVNTYVLLGTQGVLFGSISRVYLGHGSTQQAEGGMTDTYRAQGTYTKSFYPVMYAPSSVRVEMLRSAYPRVHHRVDWNATCPKIVSETLKRATL
jgi:hypothetical protein